MPPSLRSGRQQAQQDGCFGSPGTEPAPGRALQDAETERLRTHEALWDPDTFERFERLGVGTGWHCLELGAGNGSAARRLARLTGPQGRVVAADLDTVRLADDEERGRYEVWEIDLCEDELPAGAFDLAHARMLLPQLPDPQAVIAKVVGALRPGGVLFLEDTDSTTLFRSAWGEDFLHDIRTAGYDLLHGAGHEARGAHVDYHLALGAGLADVSVEGRLVTVRGGSAQARHYQLWLTSMAPQLVAAGLLSRTRIEEAVAEMGAPARGWLSQVQISTIGRRPLFN